MSSKLPRLLTLNPKLYGGLWLVMFVTTIMYKMY